MNLAYKQVDRFTLQEDGATVVHDVLTADELGFLQRMFWQWLEEKSQPLVSGPIREDDHQSYRNLFEFYPKHGMLLQNWDFGHNPMSWHVRCNPKVQNVFKDIYNTTERLITSFDGLSISLPPELTGRGWYRGNCWFHTDQSFEDSSFKCVQGLVNLFDVNEGDATFRFLRRSHLLHEAFAKAHKLRTKSDWYKLDQAELAFYLNQLPKEDGESPDTCVKCPAGSLTLWDSRTIHQGVEPQQGRQLAVPRVALYVCFSPISYASQAALLKKQRAFLERRTTNHYPYKVKLFPRYPRTWSASATLPRLEITKLEEYTSGLEESILSLAGFPS